MISDLWDYPPLPFLEQVLKHCPRAALLYIKLWQKKDKNHEVHGHLDPLTNLTGDTKTLFMNKVLDLVSEGLVSMNRTDKFICIQLVDWNTFEDEQ